MKNSNNSPQNSNQLCVLGVHVFGGGDGGGAAARGTGETLNGNDRT